MCIILLRFYETSIAYKFKPKELETQLISVDYFVGKTGIITPVAHFKPIELEGVIVKNASLYNFDEIQRLDLHENDYIIVFKSAEIIPKVKNAIKEKRISNNKIFFIDKCPSCKEKITKIDVNYYCLNENCKDKLVQKMIYFTSKEGMDIKGLGDKLIIKLIENNIIYDFNDIYELNYDKLKSINFGEKTINNLLNAIEKSKSNSFSDILNSFSIRHIGKETSIKICNYYKNIDDLLNVTKEDLLNINDIGEKTIESLLKWTNNKNTKELIKKLKNNGLKFNVEESNVEIKNILNNQTFLFTGTFNISRDELKNLIIQNGGLILNSVSSKLNYLIVGENAGNEKLKKADILNIKQININDFFNMIIL